MGFWDYISSTTNTANSFTILPVKNFCSNSYSYASSAYTKIVHDQETRSNIGRFTTSCAKNTAIVACREGLKLVPGGEPAFRIISQSLRDNKNVDNEKNYEMKALNAKVKDQNQEIENLQAEVETMKKELTHLKDLLNEPDMCGSDLKLETEPEVNRTGADMAGTCVRKGYVGCYLLDAKKQPDGLIRDFMVKGLLSASVLNELKAAPPPQQDIDVC